MAWNGDVCATAAKKKRKLTVLIHGQHAGSFAQQLLDHDRQSLPGCDVQGPAGVCVCGGVLLK